MTNCQYCRSSDYADDPSDKYDVVLICKLSGETLPPEIERPARCKDYREDVNLVNACYALARME